MTNFIKNRAKNISLPESYSDALSYGECIAKLIKSHNKLYKYTEEIEKTVETQGNEISGLTTKVTAVEKVVLDVETAIKELSQKIENILQSISSIILRVQTVEERVDNHDAEISVIKNALSIHSAKIENLISMTLDKLYTLYTDIAATKIKTVPDNSLPYTKLVNIGGACFLYNQAWANSRVINALTGSEQYTYGWVTNTGFALIKTHKYLFSAYGYGNWDLYIYPSGGTIHSVTSLSLSNNYGSKIFTYNEDDYTVQNLYSDRVGGFWCYTWVGSTVKAVTFKQQSLIDLTKMFGAGNEPTSTSDSRITWVQQYVLANPGYSDSKLITTEVNSVTTTNADGTQIDSRDIPQSIKELDGYSVGMIDGSAYNTVDFANKKYTQVCYISGTEVKLLDTPITTDISTALSNFNQFLQIESGGTIDIVNTSQIDLPNSIQYMIKTEG